MADTDFITAYLSIFFMIHGASRGFMRSFLIPFSIILGTVISIIAYQITKEMALSLLLGISGPLLLHNYFKKLLKKWATATNTDIKPNFLSRSSGIILTLAWGWFFIIFTLIMLAVLPPWGKGLSAVRQDVSQSASYHYIAKPMGMNFFNTITADDPFLSKRIINFFFGVSTPPLPPSPPSSAGHDLKNLSEDARFQNVLKDSEVQKEMEAHNFVKLMSNPKVIDLSQQIIRDPATLKEVMALYSNQADLKANWAGEEPSK